MNWERQLAADVAEPVRALVPQALEARNLCQQNKYGMALEVMWDMLLRVRRSGTSTQEAFVLIHMGKIYRNWIWDIALKFFEDGLAVAQSCGFKRGVMIAYNAMGELYYAWKKPDKALEYYRKSLEAAREIGDRPCERDIILDMVDCYEAQEDYDVCDQLLDEAIRIDQGLGIMPPAPNRSSFTVVAD